MSRVRACRVAEVTCIQRIRTIHDGAGDHKSAARYFVRSTRSSIGRQSRATWPSAPRSPSLLPTVDEPIDATDAGTVTVPRGGSETVLRVEDEPVVRETGTRILERNGLPRDRDASRWTCCAPNDPTCRWW